MCKRPRPKKPAATLLPYPDAPVDRVLYTACVLAVLCHRYASLLTNYIVRADGIHYQRRTESGNVRATKFEATACVLHNSEVKSEANALYLCIVGPVRTVQRIAAGRVGKSFVFNCADVREQDVADIAITMQMLATPQWTMARRAVQTAYPDIAPLFDELATR